MKGFQRLEEVFKISKTICIAHGGDVSEPSGGTNRVIAFATALRDAGFDVHLVVPSPKREFPEDLRDIKIHTVPIKARSIRDQIFRALLVSLKAKKIAKNNNAILQIEHSTLAGSATLVGCSNFVLDMHDLAIGSPMYLNLPFPKMIIQNFIYKVEERAVSRASKIIVVSNPMKEFIIREWKIPEKKIIVIPNGYFEKKFKNFDESVEETDGMISFLGTLHSKLDLDKIINLAKSLENSKIYIIGDGPLRGILELKIRKNDLKSIVLRGRLPDKDAFSLIARSQICILPETPSLLTRVSCPVKLFDYAALGKAIVADDVAEMCRVFKEHNAALLSDPTNLDEFIANVHKLLEDERLRRKLGENAKRLVKDFTWEKQGEKLVRMYEDVIRRFK